MKRKTVLYSIGYSALFILFTLFFVLINYPSGRLTDQVNSWIYSVSDGSLSVGKADVRFPFSVRLDGVTLDLDQRSLALGKAVVGPHILGFMTGKRVADVSLENQWLDLNLTYGSSASMWDLNVHSMEIDLSRLPEEVITLPVSLKGKVDAKLNFSSEDPPHGVSSGNVRITTGPVTISGEILKVLGLDSVGLSKGSAVATVKDNVLSLGENTLEGDLTASARGQIRINPENIMASRLDLTVDIRPGAEKKERLLPVLKLVSKRVRADGSVKFRIGGTLGNPSVRM